MEMTPEAIYKMRYSNIRYAARIVEAKAEYYGDTNEPEKQRIALEIARALRAEISGHGEEPESCPDCRGKKGKRICMGNDDCPGSEYTCEGWGAYCCHCGADYARGQI